MRAEVNLDIRFELCEPKLILIMATQLDGLIPNIQHLLALFCVFESLMSSIHGDWTSPATSTLPSGDNAFAVGAYNGTIFLLGGDYDPRQTEYHIDTDTFTSLPLSNNLTGNAQFCSQLEETMYMIKRQGTKLSTFNMITKEYTKGWIDLNQEVGTDGEACLAAANDHLFITGGYLNDNASDTLQVLRLADLEWIMNAPSMQQSRCSHACIAHYNYLWVFGGWSHGALDLNERINITDITSNQWDFIDPLSNSSYGLRAAAWYQHIFVTGGYNPYPYVFFDTVHLVDSIAGTVVLSPERLVYGTAWHGITVAQNAIYLFGGCNAVGNCTLNTWMRYELTAPTANPTTPMPTLVVPDISTQFDSSVMISATSKDSKENKVLPHVTVTAVVVVSSVAVVVLLISLCCGIRWLQKKRVKKSEEFIEPNADDNDQIQNKYSLEQIEQTKKTEKNCIEGEGSERFIEEIGVTAEGNGDIVNDVNDDGVAMVDLGGMGTRGGTDDDQNNPNIGDDEFIVEDDANHNAQNVTRY
eukprot:30521_1